MITGIMITDTTITRRFNTFGGPEAPPAGEDARAPQS